MIIAKSKLLVKLTFWYLVGDMDVMLTSVYLDTAEDLDVQYVLRRGICEK